MALKIGDNFSYNGKKPLDMRNQFSTIVEMTAFAETSLDEGHISYVKETGKYYTFNSANEVDITLGKWRELSTGGTSSDEKVKLDKDSEVAKYLNELIDNSTIEIDAENGVIKAVTLDGLETAVATLNFVKNLDKDIMLYLNSVSNPMTFKGIVADDTALSAIVDVKSGDTYIVQSSASNADKTMTFIYNGVDFVPIAETSITVRDFNTNPIDLSTETTGTLPKAKIDAAIARLADVLDKTAYKGSADGIVKQADKLTGLTTTIANLNKAVTDSHTHKNKAILDKIVSNGIGEGFLADNGQYISFLHIGTVSPTYDSQIWIDNTNSTALVLKIFDGTNWVSISNSNNNNTGNNNSVTVDKAMSDTSENPVQNKVIKAYVDSKKVDISADSNNAIENKADGIFVEDLGDRVNSINYAQRVVNRPSSVSLIYDDVYGFNLTAASKLGSATATNLNQTLKLKQSIKNFDYIEFTFMPITGLRSRPPQITRLRTDTIVYNDSTTANMVDGSFLSFSFEVETSTSGSYGSGSIIVTGWFKDDFTLFIYQATTPFNDTNWQGTYHVRLYGLDSGITVDPLEYVNEQSGIEDTPVGHIIACMSNSAPKHYLVCDGTQYNIADYPYLAEHFKTQFGSYNYFGGDGITTFSVPDLRAEFLRGSGTATRNTGSGTKVGEHQDPTLSLNFYKGYTTTKENFLAVYGDSEVSDSLSVVKGINADKFIPYTSASNKKGLRIAVDKLYDTDVTTYEHTSRPTSTSVLYCIKYEPTYYMNNTYNGNVYSTDEQIVGKWINGKTLYQKSFEFGVVNGEAITTLGKIDDMDLGFVDGSSSYYVNTNVNYAAKNSVFMLNTSGRGVDRATYTSYVTVQEDGYIVWYTGSDVATSGGVCTVKYTKNT